jgi:hypothetical protein
MASISSFIRLGLTPALLAEAQSEAEFQSVSVNKFIRVAIYNELRRLDRKRIDDAYNEHKPIKTRKKSQAQV